MYESADTDSEQWGTRRPPTRRRDMVNRIFGALLSRRAAGFQDYYEGTLKAGEGSPKIDEARKDFHRMMHAQNPLVGV